MNAYIATAAVLTVVWFAAGIPPIPPLASAVIGFVVVAGVIRLVRKGIRQDRERREALAADGELDEEEVAA